METQLQNISKFCLDTISKGQLNNGEFKTYLFFPGKSENGWIYSGPSVFLTSSIAIALLKSKNNIAKDICIRAANFVHSQMEADGLWRFYPHYGLFKFNTPMDVDDTSLASYLLSECNIRFPDNRKILLKQLDRCGNFYIWFLPRWQFFSQPRLFFRFLFDLRFSFPIFFPLKGRTDAALIRYGDFEHAVSANAILYMKQNRDTQKTINHITEDILFGNEHNYFFYPGELYTYYHVSRVYEDGVKDFENIKQKVSNFFLNNSDDIHQNVLNQAISVITLINFDIEPDLVKEIIQKIMTSPLESIAQPYAYFCTKDRNMLGGSVEFTCATVMEAIRKFQIKFGS
jgi:hypothetical protein